MRKFIAFLYLIIVPLLVITVTVKSCHVFRDWVIDKGVVKIGGYTEDEAIDALLRWIDDANDIPKAKKEIQDVFNKYWFYCSGGDNDINELKRVFDKYGILWH